MNKISVIIITLNEAENIGRALKSLSWADEIIIGDSQSKDETVSIAEKYTDKIYQVEWKGYSVTKQELVGKCRNDWILWLDADEEVSPELEEVMRRINLTETEYSAFQIPRKTRYMGKWIKHSGWYPNYVTRLFNKNQAQFSDVQVHEDLVINGKIGTLKSDILHYPYKNLEEHINKINRYSTLSASQMKDKGKTITPVGIAARTLAKFLKTFFLQLGFLDGKQGFTISKMGAFYIYCKYSKLWEIQKK
ncbi:glycosyltransferase family 2 protein [bacterium]|nr:glycosyltransferase family 2 protein [bacterium]